VVALNFITHIKDIRNPGIARRLVIYILLYSSAIALIATATQLYLDYRDDLSLLDRKLVEVERSFGDTLAAAVWNVDYEQVEVNLEGILSLPDIEYAVVTPLEDPPVRRGTPVQRHRKSRAIDLIYDDGLEAQHLGRLEIHASLSGILSRLKKKVFVVLVSQGIKTFLVCAFMFFLFKVLIIQHLEKLADFARQLNPLGEVQELNLNRKRPDRKDEFDDVTDALKQMQRELAVRYRELMETNLQLDSKTQELSAHKQNLEELVAERTEALRRAQQTLLETAHKAGMSEVASGVLHNVGNTLNSLTVSNQLLLEKASRSDDIESFQRANEVMLERVEQAGLEGEQAQGLIRVAEYYQNLARRLQSTRDETASQLSEMMRQIDATRNAVSDQQDYARFESLVERVSPRDLWESVVRLESKVLERDHIQVERRYGPCSDLVVQRSKVCYLLTHLLRNAREALLETEASSRRLVLGVEETDEDVAVWVSDNGPGIDPSEGASIFQYGFSTKPDGHGFGLHICATAMHEMGGRVSLDRGLNGHGAKFSLVFPKATHLAQADGPGMA